MGEIQEISNPFYESTPSEVIRFPRLHTQVMLGDAYVYYVQVQFLYVNTEDIRYHKINMNNHIYIDTYVIGLIHIYNYIYCNIYIYTIRICIYIYMII